MLKTPRECNGQLKTLTLSTVFMEPESTLPLKQNSVTQKNHIHMTTSSLL